MAWFIVRDAFGEVLEATPCADELHHQADRMRKAVASWRERGDRASRIDDLSYRMTSFDGNVRLLSIEAAPPVD